MKFRACVYDGHKMLVTKFKSFTLSYFKMADYSTLVMSNFMTTSG